MIRFRVGTNTAAVDVTKLCDFRFLILNRTLGFCIVIFDLVSEIAIFSPEFYNFDEWEKSVKLASCRLMVFFCSSGSVLLLRFLFRKRVA